MSVLSFKKSSNFRPPSTLGLLTIFRPLKLRPENLRYSSSTDKLVSHFKCTSHLSLQEKRHQRLRSQKALDVRSRRPVCRSLPFSSSLPKLTLLRQDAVMSTKKWPLKIGSCRPNKLPGSAIVPRIPRQRISPGVSTSPIPHSTLSIPSQQFYFQ